MTKNKAGNWVKEVLKDNGMTVDDLCSQTGLPKEKVMKLIEHDEADENTWNIVLTQFNTYPTIDYPNEMILSDLENDMNQVGPEAECAVFYGVNDQQLIFTDYKLPGKEDHGANEPIERLSKLHITLEEAYELFEKQNAALQ